MTCMCWEVISVAQLLAIYASLKAGKQIERIPPGQTAAA